MMASTISGGTAGLSSTTAVHAPGSGAMEELLPLVMQLTNADQVSIHLAMLVVILSIGFCCE
jgi:hypothetical protein